MNYTKEQTEYIIKQYMEKPSMDSVRVLADEMDKSIKSIIGKLSREGVYQRAVYKNKIGEVPVTKMEIVNNIAENLGIEVESLVGLEKSPKATLKTLELATGARRAG
tara:strand:+ start:222 stop:542 length:321 start_codon:yes stop_codon:yes gene_type:complete